MQTSFLACRLSFVSFLIPFAFVFDARLLGEGSLGWVAIAFLSLLAGSAGWAVALVGYLNRSLSPVERLLIAVGSVGLIFAPTATLPWFLALAFLVLFALWVLVMQRERGEPGLKFSQGSIGEKLWLPPGQALPIQGSLKRKREVP